MAENARNIPKFSIFFSYIEKENEPQYCHLIVLKYFWIYEKIPLFYQPSTIYIYVAIRWKFLLRVSVVLGLKYIHGHLFTDQLKKKYFESLNIT